MTVPRDPRQVTLWDALRAALSPGAGLGAHERIVLLELWRRSNFDGEAWPSVETIARDTGMGARRARQAVRKLEDAGAIETARSAGRLANVYLVVPEWVQAVLAINPAPHAALDDSGSAADTGNPAQNVPNPAQIAPNPAPRAAEVLLKCPRRTSREEGTPDGAGCVLSQAQNAKTEDPTPPPEKLTEEKDRIEARPPVRTVEQVAAAIGQAGDRLGSNAGKRARRIAEEWRRDQFQTVKTAFRLRELAREVGQAPEACGLPTVDELDAAVFGPSP